MPNPSTSNIRLVAIDLDGTLLDSRKELPAGASEVFAQAHRAGLQVSIVTGRNACAVREVAKAIRVSGPHASSGGALVSGSAGRPIFARHPFPATDIRLAVNISRRWDLAIFLQSASRILMENADRFLDWRAVPYYPCIPERRTDLLADRHFRTLKMTLYGQRENLSGALADFQCQDGRFHITSAGEEDLELTSAGVSKGTALREISTTTGIPLANIMAIGDSPNDLPMFREAGLAVAMGNALPEVKRAAAVIAPPNDEGGVLWALCNLVLSVTPVV